MIEILAVSLVVVAWVLLLVPPATELLLTVRAGESELTVLLFRAIPLLRVPYDGITSVEVLSWGEAALLGVRQIGVRTRIWGRMVLVRRGPGIPVLMTPRDPDAFAAGVRRRVREQGLSVQPPATGISD